MANGIKTRRHFGGAFRVVLWAALILTGEWLFGVHTQCVRTEAGFPFYLRIRDWKTGEIYVSSPAKVGDALFFGWIHSLEKIPWNEYYHVDEELNLVLDAITFPAFGAGIPENKGRVCYIKDGLIHMEEIGQVFGEFVWLNSHTATQDIALGGNVIARGDSLPHHTRLRLKIEKTE